MQLTDFFNPDDVISRMQVNNKKQTLQELSRHASKRIGYPERVIFDLLMERERLGTTGVGNGVAIPYGKVPSLEGLGLYGLFARLDHPIDFDSIDERPVDLIFLVLASERVGRDHLSILTRVSRLLRDKVVCAKIRDTDDAMELYVLLTDTQPARPSNRADDPLA